MHRLNCWEFMRCGKGPEAGENGGSGICTAAADSRADGLNSGVNGGRICWILRETGGNGNMETSCLHGKATSCSCRFRALVTEEEGLLKICRSTGALLTGWKGA